VFTLALDMLFPPVCVGCGCRWSAFCPNCRPRARDARALSVSGLRVYAAGHYGGSLRRAILAYKSGRRDVGDVLAEVLGGQVMALPPRIVLVPVPTTAGRRAERGFDQGVRLAAAVAERCDRFVLHVLRQRAGDAQRGRSRLARLGARDRFACTHSPLLAGANVVLVDDVVTTGSTLADCARALRACDAAVLSAVVLAYA